MHMKTKQFLLGLNYFIFGRTVYRNFSAVLDATGDFLYLICGLDHPLWLVLSSSYMHPLKRLLWPRPGGVNVSTFNFNKDIYNIVSVPWARRIKSTLRVLKENDIVCL